MSSSQPSPHDLSYRPARHYVWPNKPYQWLLVTSCGLILTTWWSRDNLLPESNSYASMIWSLGGTVPQVARVSYKIQPTVLPLLVFSHVVETGWLWWSRLARNGIGFTTASWWMWMIDSLIEGLGARIRFDEVIAKRGEGNGKEL